MSTGRRTSGRIAKELDTNATQDSRPLTVGRVERSITTAGNLFLMKGHRARPLPLRTSPSRSILPFLGRRLSEREKLAVHEARHAVAWHANGDKVKSIEIRREARGWSGLCTYATGSILGSAQRCSLAVAAFAGPIVCEVVGDPDIYAWHRDFGYGVADLFANVGISERVFNVMTKAVELYAATSDTNRRAKAREILRELLRP